MKAEKVCRLRRSKFVIVFTKIELLDVADTFARIASHLEKCGNLESVNGDSNFGRFLTKMTDVLERLKKLEARVGTDEELKEADILSYFARESQAAKNLLYRRIRCLANYEAANKNLERARVKNKDIQKVGFDSLKKLILLGGIGAGRSVQEIRRHQWLG